MRATICHVFGEPEDLEVRQVDPSPCGRQQVRVHIWAAGLNYVDALFVQGRYQIRPALPFTPGSEFAGEVTEVGEGVQRWRVGDRVMSSIGLGAFADEVIVGEDQLLAVPDQLDDRRAATMMQSYATAWYSLTRRTRLAPDEWVVVLGGAGGVGLAVLDCARALGAKVISVASTPAKLQLCIERGAHGVIDHTAEDLKERVRELTGGGADVVVDTVGGDLSEPSLRGLREGGRLLVVGFASGTIPRFPANQVLLRNRSVIGVDWGAWAMANPQENAAVLAELLQHVGNGTLSPVEPVGYPLAEVGAALRDLLERRVTGKACLFT
jgi:NADPH:quinone reductase